MIRRYRRLVMLQFAILIASLSPTLGLRFAGYRHAPAGGDGTAVTLAESREKTVAAFRAFDDFMKSNKIEDANALEHGDTFSAEIRTQFHALEKAAWDSDAEFVKLEKAEKGKARVTSVQDRLSFYTEAVQGHPMHFASQPIAQMKSAGQEFIESDAYKALVSSGALNHERAKFATEAVVAKTSRFAATDIITSNTGEGGAGLVTPLLLPGILPLPQRPLTVRDLFTNAPMSQGDTLEYAAQVAFESAANAVVQAAADGNPTGAKPQSSISWERRSSPATTIATWMAVTRQMLADAAVARSIIDSQGRLMIQLEEEDQLLAGDGSAPDLTGLTITAGVQTLDLDGVDNLDGIRVAKRLVRTGLSRLMADAIVLHPEDSEGFDLMKDNEGRYRAGDPFAQFPDAAPIWRLRRVESEGIAAGTAIVGAFRAGATVFERQPITVMTSDSHSDFFIRNLVVVLFEERIAFPVFFPSAFVKIDLDAIIQGSGTVGVLT